MAKKVDLQEAYCAALLHRLASYLSEHGFLPDPVTSGSLAPQPVILYDLEQRPLFYLFLEKNREGKITGSSWVIADPTTPPLIVTETWGELAWNPEETRSKVKKWARQVRQPGDRVEWSFICYSYPRIGSLARIKSKEGLIRAEKMFDVVHGNEISLVAQKKLAESRRSPSESRRFSTAAIKVQETASPWYWRYLTRDKWRGVMPLAKVEERAAALVKNLKLSVEKKELNVPHFRQQQDFWCVPACAQMILSNHEIYRDQEEIAGVMNTDSSGTTLESEMRGYENILEGNCRTHDTSWPTLKRLIDQGLPVRIRINHDVHAVVCRGYKREQIAGGGAEIWLIINDPYSSARTYQKWLDVGYQDNYLTCST